MKNKLLKGAHLSERKCREILQLFCDDLTATQIAEISGVSRVTVNNYFKLIRNHIASHCQKEHAAGISFYEQPDAASTYNANDHAYYGFSIKNGKICTQWLKEVGDEVLKSVITPSSGESEYKLLSSMFENFEAIADCSAWNLHWMLPAGNKSTGALSEINVFWQHTKGRLHKFRGMSKNTLNLHIKECEFRYNYRDTEIFPVLMNIINTSGSAYNVSREYDLV